MGAFLLTVAVLALLAIVLALRARARSTAPSRPFEGEDLGNEAGAQAPRHAGEPELPDAVGDRRTGA